jgi:predicted TIM-barrel enzyme
MSLAESRSKKKPQRTLAETRTSGYRYDIRLAKNLAQTESINTATTWILCPWLGRLPEDTGVWLSVLAAHDANEGLLEALPPSKKSWPNVFAGVFAVDALRSTAQLIRRLKCAGIGGVINFPSVSFIDGEAGAILNGLSLGIDREIDFLQACSTEGLRIAGVTRSIEAARRLMGMGIDFLIVHGGPPTRGDADPSQAVATQVEGIAQEQDVPAIPISHRLHCSRSNGR